MSWISVKDRMPQEDVFVLILLGEDPITCCDTDFYFFVGFYVGYTWKIYRDDIGKEQVTHWMPLPEWPEEVK